MAAARLTSLVCTIAAIALLAFPVPRARAAASPGERSLRWAERQLETEIHPTDGSHVGWLYRMPAAEDAFRGIIAKYGGNARAYIGLGTCQLRMGKYAAALRSFERAARLAPGSRVARQGLEEAHSSLVVARAVAPQLLGGQRVLQVHRLPSGSHRDLWVVLSAVQTNDAGWCGLQYRAPHLSLFQQPRTGYRKLWQSEELRDPRFKEIQWDQVALDVFAYTGSAVPEVAVWKQEVGASWAPCHLEVFKLKASRLARILSVTNELDFSVKDLRHDGRYEVWHEYRVGLYGAISSPYPWGDIYAYDAHQERYVLANREYPGEFRSDARKLLQLLTKNPGDPQLLEYLGIAREIEGRPRAALRAYRAAIAACAPDEKGTDPPFSRAILVRREATLRARLAAHGR